MNVIYFYRNHEAGFSIAKVFDTISNQVNDKKKVEVPHPRCSIFDLIINSIYVYRHRDKNAINHITGDIHYVVPSLIGCKSVLTVHDTSSSDCKKNGLKKWISELLWHKIPYRYVSKIVCISNETKRNIERFTNRKDIEVIYNPIDPSFKTKLKEINKDFVSFLIIGTAWNKNIENALSALDGIDGSVTVIGKLTSSQQKVVDKLERINVVCKSNLTDEEIINEYSKCDVVLFCSIFEGFGMPIIEAQKTGRAVITSDIEPHKEIAGKGALFVSPHDISSIRSAILKLITEDGLYNNLVQEGLENVKRFEVSKIVNEYKKLYSTL